MTTAPTTQTSPGRRWLELAVETDNPHDMAGAALCGLLAVFTQRDEEDRAEEAAIDDHAALRREYHELEQLHDAKQAMIEETLAVVKKSTSKLADAVRAVLEPVVVPQPVDPPAEPAEGDTEPSTAPPG
jgi:hypothetical protein